MPRAPLLGFHFPPALFSQLLTEKGRCESRREHHTFFNCLCLFLVMSPYIEIIRPVNGVMAAVAVVVGYIVAGGAVWGASIAYAMAAAFLILSGGMAINDYYDLDIDAKTKKYRPIPSGRMKESTALAYSAVLFAVGIMLSWLVNASAFAIATTASLLLVLYAKSLSKKAFTGNLVVAVNTGLTFVFGAAVAGGVLMTEVIALAGMALFATLAREIYKSIQDMGEDKGVRETLPIKIGISKSRMIATFSLVSAVALSPIPYWAGAFNTTYMLLISLVDLGFLYTAMNGMKSKDFGREAHYCKVFQLAALITFLVGAI